MRNRVLTLMTLALAMGGCPSDGKDGADGGAGPDGATGADGADGATGGDGEDGADGDGGPCADATPLAITGLDGLSTDSLWAFFESEPVTVQHNAASDLTYTVAGYGIDYAWDGDGFTMVPTSDAPSSQVIIATDGCSTALYEFSVDAEIGWSTVNIIHAYEGAPHVDLTVAGADIDDAFLVDLAIGTQSGRALYPSAAYAFDLWADGVVSDTTSEIVLNPDVNYTLVLYSDTAALGVLLIEDDLTETSDDEAVVRVRAAHVVDGGAQVDVYDTLSATELFADLDFGTASTAAEMPTGPVAVGIDTDDDGSSDFGYEEFDLTGYEGESFNMVAYQHNGANFLFISHLIADWGVRLLPDPVPAAATWDTDTNTPALAITDYDSGVGFQPVTDTINLTGCGVVVDLTVAVDVTHSWRGDIGMELTGPDGTTVTLHDHTGGSVDDILGTYQMDDGGTLVSADDLAAFLFSDSAGTWTLSLTDTASGDTGTLNEWTLNAGCP
jgi:subtilisin-like proprotein convertase family protein